MIFIDWKDKVFKIEVEIVLLYPGKTLLKYRLFSAGRKKLTKHLYGDILTIKGGVPND